MKSLGLFSVAEAWAAAGAEHHAPSINDIWFPLINFAIFAYIIGRYAVPPIREYIRSRRLEVVASLGAAAESKRRASSLVEEYRGRLAAVDAEMRSIENALSAEGERERAKLLADSEAQAQKIKADARFLAEQEIKSARQQLREELAREAEAGARELIERNMSPADQQRLVQDFIVNIGQTR
jgi:F-type H+-transporting ATPase subunit b